MSSYRIRGGMALKGELELAGAKNAASKALVACLLSDEPVVLWNVPQIGEMELTIELLKGLGAVVMRDGLTVTVDPRPMSSPEVPASFSKKNRIPILLLGPLLHRFGEAIVPAVGGDKIGARPVDFHTQAFVSMGAVISSDGERYVAKAAKLRGAVIELPYPSVGATENIMLAAVKAEGTTVIKNAAVEPEILDLALLLQQMGALIQLDVNRTWVIQGVPHLHGAQHRILPDRLVAASFAIGAALTDGDIVLNGARQSDLMSFLNAFRRVGGGFEVQPKGMRFFRERPLQAITLETDVFPGFATDWQQAFVMLLTQAEGISIVHETVYEERFGYTEALAQMGARIQLHRECLGSKACRFVERNYRHSAVILGPTKLQAATIEIPDIRAGFSYLLAGLIAEGVSEFTGVDHLERGYGDLPGIFRSLGVEIKTTD